MLPKGCRVTVADNSGALEAEIFGIPGGSGRDSCGVGDVVIVAIKKALPDGKVKSGEFHKGIVVIMKAAIKRKDGSIAKAGENAIVLITKQEKNPQLIGTRIFGQVARESFEGKGDNLKKIGSISKEVY